jgi:hypothetical protein
MEESLAVSSVTHVVTAIIQLNEANGAVLILLQSTKQINETAETLNMVLLCLQTVFFTYHIYLINASRTAESHILTHPYKQPLVKKHPQL